MYTSSFLSNNDMSKLFKMMRKTKLFNNFADAAYLIPPSSPPPFQVLLLVFLLSCASRATSSMADNLCRQGRG